MSQKIPLTQQLIQSPDNRLQASPGPAARHSKYVGHRHETKEANASFPKRGDFPEQKKKLNSDSLQGGGGFQPSGEVKNAHN